MAERRRVVTWADWASERGRLGAKARKRKRLRSEYMRIVRGFRELWRERRELMRRIPFVDVVTRVILLRRIAEIDREAERRRTQLAHIRTTELPILEEEIARERREFRLKIRPPPPPPPPKKVLARVSLNLYLIIEKGEHVYPRAPGKYYYYRRPKPRRMRVRRPYPKGAFQSWLECDAFLDPETREILQDEEPFPTLLPLMRKEAAREFEEEFSLRRVDPDTLTLGEVSETPSPEEIGKPPYKLMVERTVEKKPEETWSTTVERYLMTDERYDELTKDMKQYREALEVTP